MSSIVQLNELSADGNPLSVKNGSIESEILSAYQEDKSDWTTNDFDDYCELIRDDIWSIELFSNPDFKKVFTASLTNIPVDDLNQEEVDVYFSNLQNAFKFLIDRSIAEYLREIPSSKIEDEREKMEKMKLERQSLHLWHVRDFIHTLASYIYQQDGQIVALQEIMENYLGGPLFEVVKNSKKNDRTGSQVDMWKNRCLILSDLRVKLYADEIQMLVESEDFEAIIGNSRYKTTLALGLNSGLRQMCKVSAVESTFIPIEYLNQRLITVNNIITDLTNNPTQCNEFEKRFSQVSQLGTEELDIRQKIVEAINANPKGNLQILVDLVQQIKFHDLNEDDLEDINYGLDSILKLESLAKDPKNYPAYLLALLQNSEEDSGLKVHTWSRQRLLEELDTQINRRQKVIRDAAKGVPQRVDDLIKSIKTLNLQSIQRTMIIRELTNAANTGNLQEVSNAVQRLLEGLSPILPNSDVEHLKAWAENNLRNKTA